jgi:predicted O-methyltransferase YrrM
MTADSSPLVDGTLDAEGLYDQGQTVADACNVSKGREAARYLFSIAAEYRPSIVLELGTNVGISSSYLAAAGGRVTTLEASPYRLRLARQLHERLGLTNIDYVQGLFTETLDPILQRLPPVELAFIDGHHQYQPTLDYFEAIRKQARPDCVFLFDDIYWSDGMERAWAELRPLFQVTAEVGGMGVGINCQSPAG